MKNSEAAGLSTRRLFFLRYLVVVGNIAARVRSYICTIKKEVMATIKFSDTIFATVVFRGETIAMLRMNGVTSFADVLRNVRRAVGTMFGLATINLRNGSQGWQLSRTVMLSA